jgi:membrane carboxypeptidase/penicillin-binding protein
MQEDGAITAEEAAAARETTPALVPFEKPQRDFGFVFADQATREARTLAGTHGVTSKSYTIRTTIDVPLQRSVEEALQEGLSRYERNAGRVRFQGPEANLAAAIARIEGQPKAGAATATNAKAADRAAADRAAADKRPAWQRALANARLPLYDVHWTPAVVVQTRGGKRAADGLQVGLADGRIVPLAGDSGSIRRDIKLYDVVLVRLSDAKGKSAGRAELRVRPEVQGTAVVLENKTGRILAMTGGFSYPLSQLNRATQAQRQPGSAIKPLSYLAALENGLQPNTLIRDEPITFPPIGGGHGEGWSPKNYEGGGSGIITLRQALENSRNLATVHLLDGGIAAKPAQSLDRLCSLAQEMSIYRDCVRYYPFVLGAQPVRPIDLAAFYAAIANEGVRPTPHAVEAIAQDGVTYAREAPPPVIPSAADRAAFYQLKTMMQGVLQRGTARALASLAPYAAGKTGTTEDENDTWFVGFTNEITVAVWVGYDNAGDAHRTLGEGSTGASVAAPIFQTIVEAVWRHGMSKTVLAPPSAQARTALSCNSPDPESGKSRRRGSDECLRLDQKGRAMDARYRLISRDSAYARRNTDDEGNRARTAEQPWRDPNGYAAYGDAGRSAGWSRDWWGGQRRDDQPAGQGLRRVDQPAWQSQRRGFWNW